MEVQCDNNGLSGMTFTAGVCTGGPIKIKITDTCPCVGNGQWCCGDMQHIDLSIEAFTAVSPIPHHPAPLCPSANSS
jgi:hypothetical protein